MYTLCIVLILIASLLLVLAVLVQNPKSGMASNFGASNQIMGVRQTTDFLEKFTWGTAVVILVLCLVSSIFVGGSKVSTLDAEAAALQPTEQVESVPQSETPAEATVETPAETPAK
jgi:preprotein translocase subunit SecG